MARWPLALRKVRTDQRPYRSIPEIRLEVHLAVVEKVDLSVVAQ